MADLSEEVLWYNSSCRQLDCGGGEFVGGGFHWGCVCFFSDLVGMLVVGEEAVVDLEEVFLWQIQ